MQGFYSNCIALVLLWWLNGVLRGDSASLHTSHSVCWPKASLAGSGTRRWDLARNHEKRWTASMAIQQLWINFLYWMNLIIQLFSPVFMPMEPCKCATLVLYLRWLVCRIMLETFMMVTIIFFSFLSVSGCSLSYKSFQMYCTKTCQSHVSAAGNWTFDLTASLNPTFIEKGQDPGTIRNRIKWRMKKGKRQIRHMCRIKPDLFWKLIQCHHVTVESHERKFLSSSCYLRSAAKRTLQSCIHQMQGEF